MSTNIPNLDHIQNVDGYMVLEDGKIIASYGELENNEQIANLAIKIAYTAAKIPVNPDTKDSFKRISMVFEDKYVYMMTIANRKIYLVKRDIRNSSDEMMNRDENINY